MSEYDYLRLGKGVRATWPETGPRAMLDKQINMLKTLDDTIHDIRKELETHLNHNPDEMRAHLKVIILELERRLNRIQDGINEFKDLL